MKNYIDIVRNILDNGIHKQPFRNREGCFLNETIGLGNLVFSHSMKNGFPLITTRKAPFRSVCVELEGFIKGVTSKKWYEERKCKFWREWANPVAVQAELNSITTETKKESGFTDDEYRKRIQLETDDLGPVYGFQWRRFDEDYNCYLQGEQSSNGTDQLKRIVDSLAENPNDRRMVCSAWNPNQMHLMALPPCHFSWGVVVYGDEINLWWAQRSVDVMLGLPANIASYAVLLKLLARHAGLKEGNLTGLLCDAHIYLCYLDQAREIITRTPLSPPTVELTNGDFWSWDHTQIKLSNYNYHPPISMEVVV